MSKKNNDHNDDQGGLPDIEEVPTKKPSKKKPAKRSLRAKAASAKHAVKAKAAAKKSAPKKKSISSRKKKAEVAMEEEEHIDLPTGDDIDADPATETIEAPAAEAVPDDVQEEDEQQPEDRFASYKVGATEEQPEEEEEETPAIPMPTKKPRRKKNTTADASIEDRLVSIYENPDGSMPDMTSFQGRSKWRYIKALFTLLLSCSILGAVVWLGFFVLEPSANFSEEDVVLSISGQEEADVGELVRYRVRYRNAQRVTLNKTQLRIRYPKGFVFASASELPSAESNDVWDLGTMAGGESGFIDIEGQLFGSADQEQSLRAFLSYEPENFTSEFQKVDTAITKMDDSPVEVAVAGATDVLPGAETTITIDLDASKLSGLTGLAVTLDSPDQFVVRSASIKNDERDQYRWLVPLGDALPQSITMTGVFAPKTGETDAKAELRLVGWVGEPDKDSTYTLASFAHDVTLLSEELQSTLVINGNTADATIQPGEILSISGVVKNAGSEPLKNLQARVIFDSPSNDERKSLLRWADLNDPLDGAIVGDQLTDNKRRGSITWTSDEVETFASLEAGAQQVIDLTIPVKNATDEDLTSFDTDPIQAVFEVSYDGANGKEIISTVPILLTVNSDTQFTVRETVDQNDQGKDVHTVTLLINNTFHDLANIEIDADLYGDITWLEDSLQVPAGTLTYDEKTQKLNWVIEQMPVAVDILALQFAVVLNTDNPTQTNLSSKFNFRATDTVTEKPIVKIGDELLLNVPEESE